MNEIHLVIPLPNINPLAWYKFDDSSANITLDSSGNGYTLTQISSMPTYDTTNNIRGTGCANFSGSQGFNCPLNIKLINSNTYAVCFWLKISALNASTYDVIFYHNTGSTSFIIQRDQSYNRLIASCFGGSLTTDNIYTADNTWRHFSFVFENISGSTKISYYLNGVFSSTTTSGTWAQDTTSLYIGCYTSGGYGLKGYLDDIRIYSQALTADEISKLYNAQVAYLDSSNLYYTTTRLNKDFDVRLASSNIITTSKLQEDPPSFIVYNQPTITNGSAPITLQDKVYYTSFTSSGSITFTTDVKCDILVVGGGGAGGTGPYGGGGGAGEVVF